MSSLSWACTNNNTDIAKFLLNFNADPNVWTTENQSPLMWASRFGNSYLVKKLLQNKADINFQHTDGATALYRACEYNKDEIVDILIDANANPDICTNVKNKSPLIKSSAKGNAKIVKKLLQNKPNINIKDFKGQSALFWACKKNRKMIVEILLNANANPNICENKKNKSPLMIACQNGNVEIVQTFIHNEVDLNLKDIDGKTALEWAVEKGHDEIGR